MTSEFYGELLKVLMDISNSLRHVPFWEDYDFWSIVVLSITLIILIRYTIATEKIKEYYIMPAVDANMVYDENQKKTYFWFSNSSKIPALVSMKLKIKDKVHKIDSLRIPPNNLPYQELRSTAINYDFLEGIKEPNNIKAILNIKVGPAFDKNKTHFSFTKSYEFNSSQQWVETTWFLPDPKFPDFKVLIEKGKPNDHIKSN